MRNDCNIYINHIYLQQYKRMRQIVCIQNHKQQILIKDAEQHVYELKLFIKQRYVLMLQKYCGSCLCVL